MAELILAPISEVDAERVATELSAANWHGDRYPAEHAAGTRAALVAAWDGVFVGHLSVLWRSDYLPFRERDTPEISNFNVLPQYRRRRIGTALMDAAEELIAARGDIAGIGVGLYADYTPAHIMYLRRGYLPDGRGIAYRDVTVAPGAQVRVDDDLVLWMTRKLR